MEDERMQQQKQNVQDKHNQEAVINNRRFAKLKQLREEGDFFGEEAIKLRHPYLYELHVGRYRKQHPEVSTAPQLFSETLCQHLMNLEYKKLLLGKSPDPQSMDIQSQLTQHDKFQKITAEDLAISQQNLIDIVEQMFLAGKDIGVDYHSIDNDDTLDDRKEIDNDEEDHYFGREQQQGENTDTGIQDY